MPYDENKGIGAKPMIANPTMLDPADANNADPVSFAAYSMALNLLDDRVISSLYRSVICIE